MAAVDATPAVTPEDAEAERRLGRAVAVGLPAGTTILAVATMLLVDTGTAILVLAAGVLLAVIGLLWASVRTLAGDAPASIEEALAVVDGSLDDQKRLVLQALRDLEQEHALGKIDDADYQELVARYRAEAKRLLRSLDEDRAPARAKAAAWVARAATEPRAASPAPAEAPRAGATCAACSTANDADATFCKRCGARIEVADAS